MKKTKRQFILDTLLPFKEDTSTCGFENKSCVYLTNDGNKCAVGKHMKEGKWQHCQIGFTELLKGYKKEDVLTDEALEQNLTTKEWSYIQGYHDSIALNHRENSYINLLELRTGLKFPELKY